MRRLDLMGSVYLQPLSGVYGKDLLRLPHCTSRYNVKSHSELSRHNLPVETQSDSFLNLSTTHIIPSVSSLQYLTKSARTLAISSSVALPYVILS